MIHSKGATATVLDSYRPEPNLRLTSLVLVLAFLQFVDGEFHPPVTLFAVDAVAMAHRRWDSHTTASIHLNDVVLLAGIVDLDHADKGGFGHNLVVFVHTHPNKIFAGGVHP